MITSERSQQCKYVFGTRARNWLDLPREAWADLRIPAHLEDQVFRISLAQMPTAHYFELHVSEQCPKDTYARLAQCIASLKKDHVVLSIIHARASGVHLIFWRLSNPNVYHHLDLDPARPSNFDKEVLAALHCPAPRRIIRLFELMDGQNLSQSFFMTLRNHMAQIPCKSEENYYAMVDLVLKLIFLIFVQRKRWLNFDPYYLENKMNAVHNRGLSIVSRFFTPLFAALEGLHVASDFPLGQLPHLGGGLFTFRPEQLPPIGNAWLIELYHNLVSRYSFSLFEARQGRKILGISPEVLGHVFENLLLGDDRKAQGTFYTPLHVAYKQVEAAVSAWRKHNCPNEEDWKAALPGLRLLDPSCGSGTYLVAAFDVLVRHRLAFLPKCERYNGKLYELKKEVVLNNLFGIDIHPMAVKLAEVRLWLNMIQDLEITEPEKAPALPNLKHHLRPGDFLARHLGGEMGRVKTWPKYARLESLRQRFPSSSPRSRPVVLRQMYRLERELEIWLQSRSDEEYQQQMKTRLAQRCLPGYEASMDPITYDRKATPSPILHVVFSRVFLEGGFHLIIGNPPWLRASGVSKEQKEAILNNLEVPEGLILKGQVDLSLYFVSSCLNLLKAGGHLSFLLPGKVLRCKYAKSIRMWLWQRCSVDYLFDYGIDQKLLFDADTFPLALGVTRLKAKPQHLIQVERFGRNSQECYQITQPRLSDSQGVWFIQNPTKDDAMYQWPRLSETEHRVQQGIITGAKKYFTFTETPDGPPGGRLRPLLRGRDMQVDQIQPGGFIYWPFDLGVSWYEKLADEEQDWLQKTGKLQRQGSRQWLRYRPRPFGPWILIWKYLARTWQVALLRTGEWVPDQTTYFINFQDFGAAYRYYAWFHSHAAARWLDTVADRGKDRHLFFYAHTVSSLPVPPDLETRPMKIPEPCELLPAEGKHRWCAS